MKAATYKQFQQPITIETVPDPSPPAGGVVVRVEANGICRSDWYGWMGHDPDIALPHVPGHELAGVIEAVGTDVRRWKIGDRITVPFAMGCGHCEQCQAGNHHICDNHFQPGFTAWGAFAEFVALPYADTNLVRLPETMGFVEAAGLGCRFITAFRAVVAQGRVSGGTWLAVHGCGGVGLSAIMIADALGAQVIGVDINPDALALARKIGATHTLNAAELDDIPAAVRDLTRGGAHVSLDALGSPVTARNSILGLRKQGRHVQVGLLPADKDNTPLPMSAVVGRELEIVGSHGMQAHVYPQLWEMISAGRLQPQKLVSRTVDLVEGAKILQAMGKFQHSGVAVITKF